MFTRALEKKGVPWRVVLTHCDKIDGEAIGQDVAICGEVRAKFRRVTTTFGVPGAYVWPFSRVDGVRVAQDLVLEINRVISQ